MIRCHVLIMGVDTVFEAEQMFTDAIGLQLKKKGADKPYIWIPYDSVRYVELNIPG